MPKLRMDKIKPNALERAVDDAHIQRLETAWHALDKIKHILPHNIQRLETMMGIIATEIQNIQADNHGDP